MGTPISPKYLMKLAHEIHDALWDLFPTNKYRNVGYYIEKWHEEEGDGWNHHWENFSIYKRDNGEIDLLPTISHMSDDLLLKIAIDLGIETPDFIPCIPTFKNELKQNHLSAYASFEKALKEVEENPDLAVGLANSTLESVIKEVMKDSRVNTKYDRNKTLYDLTKDLLKEFSLYPSENIPTEIKVIGSSFLNINQNIEKLKSETTNMHGKTSEDWVLKESTYAYFRECNLNCIIG